MTDDNLHTVILLEQSDGTIAGIVPVADASPRDIYRLRPVTNGWELRLLGADVVTTWTMPYPDRAAGVQALLEAAAGWLMNPTDDWNGSFSSAWTTDLRG